MSFALAATLVAIIGSFSWWAASTIDERSMARQARAVQRGIGEVLERIPVEQDSSVAWDDAVINLRAGNEPWLAENLAEWMSEYFGHNRVYILDPTDNAVRSVSEGVLVDNRLFSFDAPVLKPLVEKLRAEMAKRSMGLEDSTSAITGLGEEDLVVLGDGQPAIASVRPVVPTSGAVSQAPGTEYLHISIRLINSGLAAEISERYEISDLKFERAAAAGATVSLPVMNSQDRIIGFFTWTPTKPAQDLIWRTLPIMMGGLLLGGAGVVYVLGRLQRTSIQLEDTQAQASFLAFHDPMTRLPNRALFEDRLEQALANMRDGSSLVALHYVDLDRFKQVNDTFGHAAGDELLRQSAERLKALVAEVDTVARLGGDEFAVIQFHPADTAEALTLGQRIVDAFAQPFETAGQSSIVGASVGVAIVSDSNLSMGDLMVQADTALYEAKNSGRGRYQAYDGELNAVIRDRRALESDLRDALNGTPGLELVYQPIYTAQSGKIAGAEALVRWVHPTRGRMSPANFISLAEERGLIDQLGLWVLREACAYAASSDLPWVAVNASPLQFRDERFADRVFEILDSTGLAAKRLEIEITEGLLLQNSSLTQSTLMRLRARGIRVALDDFGTGYSSISYLRTHGIDKLKIDQSYTAQLGIDPEIDSIVRSIVDLGQAMHMVVTAEGVETEEQRTILQGIGCQQLQGYLLSRPVEPARLAGIVAGTSTPKARRRA